MIINKNEPAVMLNNVVKSILQTSYMNYHFIIHVKTDAILNSILIMEETGKAFCRVYMYHDNKTSIYLDWLSVNDDSRKQRLGTTLQELREHIGKQLGYTTAYLYVNNFSWMHEWYKRRGYQDWIRHEVNEDCIWMWKDLK